MIKDVKGNYCDFYNQYFIYYLLINDFGLGLKYEYSYRSVC